MSRESTPRADVSPLPHPPPPGTPTTAGSALDGRAVEMRARAETWLANAGPMPFARTREDLDSLGMLYTAADFARHVVALSKERDELKCQVVGLSADVTRLEGELEARSSESDETREETTAEFLAAERLLAEDLAKYERRWVAVRNHKVYANEGSVEKLLLLVDRTPVDAIFYVPDANGAPFFGGLADLSHSESPLPSGAAEVRVKELEQQVSALAGARDKTVALAADWKRQAAGAQTPMEATVLNCCARELARLAEALPSGAPAEGQT